MQIIIQKKNIKDSSIDSYIKKRFAVLEKFLKLCHTTEEWEKLKPSCEVFVEVWRETMHHQKGLIFGARAWVRIPGKTIEADDEGQTAEEAVDKTKDEFLAEIKRYKSKRIDLNRKRQRKAKENINEI